MATKARGFHRSSLIFGAGSRRNRLGQPDSTPWLPADGMERSLAVAHHYLADAHRRTSDAVLVWKIDRFSRSLKHVVNALADCAPM